MPIEPITCPLHTDLTKKVDRMEIKQDERPCQGHEERIKNAEKVNDLQWTEINLLKKLVYMGAGAAAVLSFLGSIIGSWIKGH
jgi:hypothetical protein